MRNQYERPKQPVLSFRCGSSNSVVIHAHTIQLRQWLCLQRRSTAGATVQHERQPGSQAPPTAEQPIRGSLISSTA
eukprot:7090362-Lingulodinium_polyedra.AAC.1